MLVTEDNKHIMLEALSRERFFALDTETTGLEWTDKPFALVVATESQTFYTEHVHIIRELFDVPCTVIMANAKFDMRMIGLPFYSCWNIRDISIFERILSNDAPSIASYSLDVISKKRLGLAKLKLVDEYIKEHGLYDIRKTKYTQEEYKVPRFDKVPRDILQKYAELDARLTYDCYKSQVISATSDDIKVFENECKLLHATYKMEMEGILLDSTYTENALLYESSLLEKAKENFSSIVGKPYENKKSLLIPLFENSGEKIQYTSKGNPRLTDDDLESYTSPAARLVQQIRYHEKRISTYFTSYLGLADDNDLIHASILQHGTKTGRFSYAAPNLQNIPKDEPKENPYCVRGCFVPEKGNIFLSLDYSQQEYRLMLDYAGETRVIKEVMGGKDLHQAIADMAKISRKQAKTLSFAILYGSGPAKVAEMLGIPEREARKLRDNYLLALPRVDKLIADVISRNRQKGHVRNWFGRVLRNTYDNSYKAPNHLIQGGCGDIIKVAMVQIHDILKGSGIKMRLQVHDQLVFEGHREELLHKYAEICMIMQSIYPSKNGIVLTTDASFSTTSFAERDMQKWEMI